VNILTLRSFGFSVEDLGVNVPAERFLQAATTDHPDIIGLSGLLTVAFTSMRDTVTLLRDHADEFPTMPLIIIGGGTIDEQVARFVGADLWTSDAMHGVRLCEEALATRRLIETRS
jgi:methanogenic corrinoid protein MtbC1